MKSIHAILITALLVFFLSANTALAESETFVLEPTDVDMVDAELINTDTSTSNSDQQKPLRQQVRNAKKENKDKTFDSLKQSRQAKKNKKTRKAASFKQGREVQDGQKAQNPESFNRAKEAKKANGMRVL